MTGTMTDERIKQPRGPTIEFTGRQIASTEFETRGHKPMSMILEIWLSEGGALIAVTSTAPARGDGFEDVRAVVSEPQDDVQAMRFAVMNHFNWEARARDMVRKQLPEWDLVRRVL